MSKAKKPPGDDEPADITEDIIHWVKCYVWSGEYDADEIPLLIDDQLYPEEEVDEKWLRKLVRSEFTAKRKAEKTWPKVTDYDRLAKAFQALKKQNFIAIHSAGFTQSDGLDIVESEYKEAGGKKSKYAGHCFYTEQDQEGAMFGSEGMYIAFGHLSGNDKKGVEVGRAVRDALTAAGLTVVWDETIGSRIFVKGFRWQRRGPK